MTKQPKMPRRFFIAAFAGSLALLAGASTVSAKPETTTIEHDGGKTTIKTDRDGTTTLDFDKSGDYKGRESTPEKDHKKEADRVREELDRHGQNPK